MIGFHPCPRSHQTSLRKSFRIAASVRLLLSSLTVLVLSGQSPALAGTVLAVITDKLGNPVADGVVYAMPVGVPVPAANTQELNTISITQKNYVFVPYVSVVRTGTNVRFSNEDPHDHHIKSFSPAKSIDLRIATKKEDGTLFNLDKAGEIALVCYFHDWMRGFVYAVDTPYFAKTDKTGNALLTNLPAGKYEIKAWVPKMLGEALTQKLEMLASDASEVKFQLNFIPATPPKPVLPKKKVEATSSSYEYTR